MYVCKYQVTPPPARLPPMGLDPAFREGAGRAGVSTVFKVWDQLLGTEFGVTYDAGKHYNVFVVFFL